MTTSNVATLAGDKSVSDLANRLVSQGVVPKPADMAAFTNALAAANPHLGAIGALPAGTPIVIPATPTGPTIGAETDPAVHAVMDGLRRTLSGAQAVYALAAANQKAKAGALQAPEALKDITTIQATDAALGQKLVAISGGVKANLTAIDAAVTAQTTALQNAVTHAGATASTLRLAGRT